MNAETKITKPIGISEGIPHESTEAKTQGTNSIASKEREIAGIKFRRTKDSYDQSLEKQLDIPKELLDNQLQYRWVNEENIDKYKNRFDYAIINESHFGKNKVSVKRRVGTNKDGSVKYVVLMATPKEWKHERDMARAEQDAITLAEAAKGRAKGGESLPGTELLSDRNRKLTIETK